MNRSLTQVCALIAAALFLLGATDLSARVRQARPRSKGSVLVQKTRPRGVIRTVRRRPPRAARNRAEPAHRTILRAIGKGTGSVSIGNTSTGHLLRAARLPFRGKHYAVLPRWRKRRTNYGTNELMTLLKHAASRVAKAYPRSRMMLGNLSQKAGGDIRWSHSHNAGRDGDIAFYLKRGRRFVVPQSLVKINPRLRAQGMGITRFDVRRNWALIAALLTHRTVQVQWVFIAKYLKAALLKYARRIRVSATLVARADKILRQPTDSLSHADHFHVRIYCSGQDRLQGCLDRAPFWPGVKTHDRAVARRIRILMAGLRDSDTAFRVLAIAQLVRLDARTAAASIARHGLKDTDARVRRAALGALLRWRSKDRAVVIALTRLIERPGSGVLRNDPQFERPARGRPDTVRTSKQLRLAYDLLAKTASRQFVPLLRRALRSKRTIPGKRRGHALPEPLLAASAARSVLDLRLVPALLAALEHPSGAVRRVAAGSLRRLTNHTYRVSWAGRLGKRRRKRLAARWSRWWRRHRRKSREALVRKGFRRVNRRLRNLKSRRAQWVLVSYTRRQDHLGFNAHRMLRVLSGQRWRSPVSDNYARRYQRWRRWFRKRWRRRRLRRPRRRRKLRRIRRRQRRAR